MKHFLIFLFVCTFPFLYCQKSNEVRITLPEMRVFYTGYDNLVEISFQRKKISKIVLECEGCYSIKRIESHSNQWAVVADSVVPLKLTAKTSKGKILAESYFNVFSPPLPTVYLDSIHSQSVLSNVPNTINLKYEASVPLNVKFLVKSWTISINDRVFVGVGKQLTEEVQKYMQSVSQGVLVVEITFFSPSGKQVMKELFEFKMR